VILHSLTLDGVGPYADRQCLEFANDERKPVTLIGGLNGSGKTTLIRALFQVLYGARSLPELGSYRSYGAFLEDAVNKEREEASLELALRIPGFAEDALITVRRRWPATARSAGGEQLDVFVGDAYDEQLSESWDETIEQIAPLGVARLFFFDGERIEAVADLDSAAESLRTAVGSLLGLDLVSQLQADLVAVQRRALRVADSPSSATLEERQAELTAASELLSQAQRGLEGLRAELEEAEAEHEKLRTASRAAGGELVAERTSLEEQAEESGEREEGARARLRELAADPLAPLALIPGLLDETLKTAEQSEHSRVGRDLLKVLSGRDKWVLEEAKRLGIEDATAFKKALAEDRGARKGKGAAPAFHPVSSADAVRAAREEHLTDWRVEAIQAIDALDEVQRQTDDLDRQASKIPHDDSVKILLDAVEQSERRLRELRERLEGEEKLLSAAEQKVEATRSRRDAELARLAEIEDGRERHERINRHAERARETLALLDARIAERHVGRIADYAMQCLEQLLRKDRLIEGVEIDPRTFAVTLTGAHGTLQPGALSAGERQLTALSLFWALARAAGLPLPVVIDTPLGRLDAGHRRHVVERYLPAASHQVVVLSTDTEIDSDLHALLRPSLGAERRLDNDADGRTTINDGYLEVVAA
jgi:DNA sulfur modification protein DndD